MSRFPTAQDRIDTLRLARTPGIGPVNFARLLTQYRSAAEALDALPGRMRRAGRAEPPAIPGRGEIEGELERVQRIGGGVLLRGDPDYPLMLSFLPDPPPLLFYRGDPACLSRRAVGVVGARNASAGGMRLAESLSRGLAESGLCVVSGLARGIDSAAHKAALEAGAETGSETGSGLTAAAIAGGLDIIYPPENAALQERIAREGCVITEAPPGTVPQARHFPRRNRLIAGISLGCLVVEAAACSGTLITARLALEYGREVFAVPGSPLDPRSRGGNDLLRQGATLAETAADILPVLPDSLPLPSPPPWLESRSGPGFSEGKTAWNGPADRAWEDPDLVLGAVRPLLSVTPVAVDEVARRCQFSVSAVLSMLSELELGGVVEFVPGGRVALLPEARRA